MWAGRSMNTFIAFSGVVVGITILVRYRERTPAKVARWGVALVLPLALLVLCCAPSRSSFMIFAWGYGDLHLLEPIRANELKGFWWPFSLFTRERSEIESFTQMNFDGKRMFVDGWCGVCGKPWGPPGAVVLAKLPKGFAYARHQPHPRYEHLSAPVYITATKVFVIGLPYVLTISLLLTFVPWVVSRIQQRWIVPEGHCGTCRYNLAGNMSGVCPECGATCEPNPSGRTS